MNVLKYRENYKKNYLFYTTFFKKLLILIYFLRKNTLDPNVCKTLPGDGIRLLTVKFWFDQTRFLDVMLLIALK